MAAIIATDSEGDSSGKEGDNEEEDGAKGGVFFSDGVKLSREEDGGAVDSMASAFGKLKMIDPRRKIQ